jgi:hypothetical protein
MLQRIYFLTTTQQCKMHETVRNEGSVLDFSKLLILYTCKDIILKLIKIMRKAGKGLNMHFLTIQFSNIPPIQSAWFRAILFILLPYGHRIRASSTTTFDTLLRPFIYWGFRALPRSCFHAIFVGHRMLRRAGLLKPQPSPLKRGGPRFGATDEHR